MSRLPSGAERKETRAAEIRAEERVFGSMGKRVKGYLVFTSKIYRIIICLLMPAALTALGVWTGAHVGDTRLALVLMAMLLALTEVVSDAWLFGGLQARDAEKMDYLKVSGRGMALMRNALALDLFRKFLTALCTIGAAYLIIGQVKGGLQGTMESAVDLISRGDVFQKTGFVAYLVLLAYWASALGTFLSRYGSTFQGNLMLGYGAMVLAGLAGLLGPSLVQYPSGGIFLLDLLCLAAGIGVSVLAVRAAMGKVEGGYHDE